MRIWKASSMKSIFASWAGLSKLQRRLVLGLLACVAIGGLGWLYVDYRLPSWNEEVMLSDGRMLIVHRRHDYVEGYGVSRTWLTFSLPEMGGKQTWSEWMYPAIVDVSHGKVYVVGATPGVKQYSGYSNPRYMLVAYLWDGSAFSRVPFVSVPENIRQQWNVLYCSMKGENTTWREKTIGWCGAEGIYEVGKSRTVDLRSLETASQIEAKRNGQSGLFSE